MKQGITISQKGKALFSLTIFIMLILSMAVMPLSVIAQSANAQPEIAHLLGDQWGNGADGNLGITGSEIFDMNQSTKNSNRNCADAVSYSVIGLNATSANVVPLATSKCLTPGDEVLVISLQGTGDGSDQYENVGRYEYLTVANISNGGKQVNFATSKTLYYGNNSTDDSNIGITSSNQRVMLMRVPNYNNVTVNGTLTGSSWNGFRNGVLAFRVKGLLKGMGTIDMSYRGYRGKAGPVSQQTCGESYAGLAKCYGGGISGGVNRTINGTGGGYGSPGTSNEVAKGGIAYGVRSLNSLFFGSAGGWSSCPDDALPCRESAAGGNGGGIIHLFANAITFEGSIKSNGSKGVIRSGGGAGGSVRIEASTINQLTTSAIGGPAYTSDGPAYTSGGDGRIAIYYQNSALTPPGGSSTPRADVHQIPATPTPTNIPIPFDGGTGADGELIIPSGTAFNINAHNQSRNCFQGGDAVSYNVTLLGSNYAKLNVPPMGDCLKVGDEILLINMQGIGTKYPNTGRYEFLHVKSISQNRVNFNRPKTHFYGETVDSDSNIGVSPGLQRVVLMRVPNYQKVTVLGMLTGSPWNGWKHGLLVFRVQDLLNGNGTISMSKSGYRGTDTDGYTCGESYGGWGFPCLGGGAAGANEMRNYAGGGAYGTDGVSKDGIGGKAYGDRLLNNLFPGSAGGYSRNASGLHPGGNGGGIIYILANKISFAGNIETNGHDLVGGAHAGSGAGGSIRIESYNLLKLNARALGGFTYPDSHAKGGNGRIAIYHWNNYPTNASVVPVPYIKQRTTSSTVTPTPTSTPTSTPFFTPTYTATHTPTPSSTTTSTPTDTETATPIWTATDTETATTTSTPGPSPTFTATDTATPLPAPYVVSSVRAGANPATTTLVTFTITFSQAVSGVDITDFGLTTTGLAVGAPSGASVTTVTQVTPATYSVTVDTGTQLQNGTIRLDVLNDQSIVNSNSISLANSFTAGETYTMIKAVSISGNTGIAYATLTYTIGIGIHDSTADSAGNYTINVPYNWSGDITPSLAGYLFEPTSREYTNLTLSQTAQNYTARLVQFVSIPSDATKDGWVLESSENSGQGGTLNTAGTLLYLGDNETNYQYRSFLSFNTLSLPNNAVIISATLKFRRYANDATMPNSNLFEPLVVDIKSGYFGATANLETDDFAASPSQNRVCAMYDTDVISWLSCSLPDTVFGYINLVGTTQFRLRFFIDDNNNSVSEYMRFYTSNHTNTNVYPVLEIQYYIP